MLCPFGGKTPWLAAGLVGLTVLLGVAGCSSSETVATEASTPTAGTADPAAESPIEETIGGFRATVIDPPRVTILTSQTPGAQINLRSQPTTLSPILSSGAAGDEVRLLRLAEGEGGHTWYYAQNAEAEREGWVRGDFVDISNATPLAADPGLATDRSAQPALSTTNPCDSDRQEAFFETQSYAVYLCQSAQGLRYVSTHKTTQDALITDDVAVNRSIYIAIDGNQQYHVSDTHLAVYEVHDGSYTPLKTEPVLRFERFLY